MFFEIFFCISWFLNQSKSLKNPENIFFWKNSVVSLQIYEPILILFSHALVDIRNNIFLMYHNSLTPVLHVKWILSKNKIKMSKICQEQISTKILENDCNQDLWWISTFSISFLLIKMIRPLSLKKPSLKSDRFFWNL